MYYFVHYVNFFLTGRRRLVENKARCHSFVNDMSAPDWLSQTHVKINGISVVYFSSDRGRDPFTRYRTNFRPVENSYTYGFRSHGTKLNVRKLTHFAVQKFERQNRGRIFSRCSRKFDRCALKTSEHHKRPIFFTVKAWLRECEAAQLEEESTEGAILIALLGNITALMENIIIQLALTCTAYQAGKRRCVSALLQAESRIQKRRLAT